MLSSTEIIQLLESFGITVAAFFISWALGLIFSLGALALEKESSSRIIQFFNNLLSHIGTGIPHLVLILLAFYGTQILIQKLFSLLGLTARIDIPPLLLGAIVLGFFFAAYFYKVIKEQLDNLPRDQLMATEAFALPILIRWKHILGPQILLRSLGYQSNLTIGLLKETSLLSLITVNEIFRRTELIASRKQEYFLFYGVLILIYALCSKVVESYFHRLESKSSFFWRQE